MKNTVFPQKFWRPFLDCMPQLFFRPQYVWFPVHFKGLLIPLWYETLVVNWQNWLFTLFHQSRSVLSTPYMMGDTYVPRFWPPFLTLWVPNSIFLGCFLSSTNTKTIFWVQILTKFDLFGPKIPFCPRSFWVQFSVAHGTPPAIFGPSTTPPPPPPPPGIVTKSYSRSRTSGHYLWATYQLRPLCMVAFQRVGALVGG